MGVMIEDKLRARINHYKAVVRRLASGEAFTTSFYITDNREGDELKARMRFAQEALNEDEESA